MWIESLCSSLVQGGFAQGELMHLLIRNDQGGLSTDSHTDISERPSEAVSALVQSGFALFRNFMRWGSQGFPE